MYTRKTRDVMAAIKDFVKADKIMHRDGEGWLEMYEGRLDFWKKMEQNFKSTERSHLFSWGPVL